MSGRPTILSIGAAVQDVFLSGEVFKPHKDEDGKLVEEFSLGAKLDVEGITFSTGGGATNGSVTFARQGLKAIFMGKIGRDPAGEAVLADLKREGVDVSRVSYDDDLATGYSALLLAPSGERTILTYRGASNHFEKSDFKIKDVKADWVFITSLAGEMEVLEMIINHAKNNHMKIALIPGKGELKNADKLREIVKQTDIFSANVQETAQLVAGDDMRSLAWAAAELSGGIAVVTDGPKGVAASDGSHVCSAGMYEDVPVIDRTGAGDAFASGFTAAIAQGKSIEDSIVVASANSTSVVSKIGAKAGILTNDAKLHGMEINCH